MRRLVFAAALLALSIAAPHAQEALTTNQRDTDLGILAGTFAKQYAPYEWKRDVIGFDLYRLTPWTQRVHHADDLDFQEALIDYVASLNDAHSTISFPSNFSASLGFTVDVYDGKVLIDSINRTLLPAAQFPFGIGDELVAMDGQPAAALVASFAKYFVGANPQSTARLAAIGITSRSQSFMPHAAVIGDTASTVIRIASSGVVSTFAIPWQKTGFALESQGPVPSPLRGNGRFLVPPSTDALADATTGSVSSQPFQLPQFVRDDNNLPAYLQSIRPLLSVYVPRPFEAVRGLGARTPIFNPPAGFVLRLGTLSSHFFLSGTYVSNGVRIGFLRIPTMAPPNATLALQQLDQEIAFFNANTDVLVVDTMRNTGGSVDIVEAFAQRLFTQPFQSLGFEIRATAQWLTLISNAVDSAQAGGAPASVVANLRAILNEIRAAFSANRGRTAPVSLTTGSLTLSPSPNGYTKPVLLLVDEFTASGGDMFAAIVQDNHRGSLFGNRTMGAGGSVDTFDCTAFTESRCFITVSLMNRGRLISTPDFPPSPYIENVGVRPEIAVDYMTRANLMGGGTSFVQAFTNAAVTLATANPH